MDYKRERLPEITVASESSGPAVNDIQCQITQGFVSGDAALDNTRAVTNMDSKLFTAVTFGDESSFEKLLRTDSSIIQQVTPVKDTCLHIAAGLGHDGIAKMILAENSKLLFEVNLLGETALHRATRAGHCETVQLLIDTAKEDVESGHTLLTLMRTKNDEMETATHVAVSNSHVEILTSLIKEDPELLCSLNNVGESPLHVAVEKGNLDMVKEILKRSNLSYEGPNGRTALHASVINDRADITTLLLRKMKKELVQKGDTNGRTALHFAAGLGFRPIVEILIEFDVSTTCFLDHDGFAAIHIAAIYGHLDVIKQFLKFQPDLKDLLDESRRNLLQIAIKYEQVNVVKYILRKKRFEEQLYRRDEEGNTPLHQAAIIGYPYLLNILARDKRITAMAMTLNKKCCTALSIARSSFEKKRGLRQVLVLITLLHIQSQPYNQRSVPRDVFKYVEKYQAEIPAEVQAIEKIQKDESETLMVVSALVVTVTFTAALTISGGQTITKDKASDFETFLQFDYGSLIAGLISVLLLITAQVLPFRNVAAGLLLSAQLSTIISLGLMTMAFISGTNIIHPTETNHRGALVPIFFGLSLVVIVAMKLISLIKFLVHRSSYMFTKMLSVSKIYVCHLTRFVQNPNRKLSTGEIFERMNTKINQVSEAS